MEGSTEEAALFAQGTRALAEGRAVDAIGAFEGLADRGVLDPAAAFDRGLAYAGRVRMGAEVPGDLGRAAHGFEEARSLGRDPRLEEASVRALATVRAEVARRSAHAGERVDMDQNVSFGRALVHAASEDAWAGAAVGVSVVLALALGVRFASAGRVRVGATVAASIAAALLLGFAALTLSARSDRLHLREAVVVVQGARLSDDRGLPLSGTSPEARPRVGDPAAQALPEAAKVEILGERPAWTLVRWGAAEGWVPSGAVREIARP